jgi:hypothetical protein
MAIDMNVAQSVTLDQVPTLLKGTVSMGFSVSAEERYEFVARTGKASMQPKQFNLPCHGRSGAGKGSACLFRGTLALTNGKISAACANFIVLV